MDANYGRGLWMLNPMITIPIIIIVCIIMFSILGLSFIFKTQTPDKIESICKNNYKYAYILKNGSITHLTQTLDENNKPIKCEEK